MFRTRLNPTKPPAAHRAVLERVGAACRELRPIEDACFAARRENTQITAIFAKHGAFGIGIAPEYGGAGTDPLLAALAAERIGRDGFGPASFFVAHAALGAATIARHGTAEQKAHWLPPAARGDVVFGFAHHEPPSRDESRRCVTTVRESSDGYVLTGRKRWVVNACDRATLIVTAGHATNEKLSAFLVPCQSRGLRIEPSPGQAILPSGMLCDVWFENCEIDRTAILGEPGDRDDVAFSAQLGGRLLVAAAAVGVVADSLEAMSEITAKRIANDEAAVTLDQVESHIAQTAVELEAARALVYAAAELKAEYDPRPTRGHLRLETDTLVAEAKHFAVGVVNRMFSRAARIDVAGTPLNELLPERHRRVPRATVLFEETAELLEEKIAPYYLF